MRRSPGWEAGAAARSGAPFPYCLVSVRAAGREGEGREALRGFSGEKKRRGLSGGEGPGEVGLQAVPWQRFWDGVEDLLSCMRLGVGAQRGRGLLSPDGLRGELCPRPRAAPPRTALADRGGEGAAAPGGLSSSPLAG